MDEDHLKDRDFAAAKKEWDEVRAKAAAAAAAAKKWENELLVFSFYLKYIDYLNKEFKK